MSQAPVTQPPLAQIADHLRVMLASSTELHDGMGNITATKSRPGRCIAS